MRKVDALFEEEEFHDSDRKAGRKERKRVQAADRSKHKKTDKKKTRAPYTGTGERGRVLSITKEGMVVQLPSGTRTCPLRGALKKEKTLAKNLIAVGDFVYVEEGAIVYIEERTSHLSRADNLRRRQEHLIAANIDQVLIVVSLTFPRLKPALVDRYIIAARRGNMKPVIVLNKIDLLATAEPEEKERYAAFIAAYDNIIEVSAETGFGLDALRAQMKDRSSVFSGQSGVGKTSLINAMLGSALPVGEIAYHKRKGTHTTSTPTLIPLATGGFCIDTPGIKSFGLWDVDKETLHDYFPEIAHHANACRYRGCQHNEEPGCAVKQAVEEGLISPLRYESFLTLNSQE